MKKWITVDSFAVSFISALAYGFGYSVPRSLGAPFLLCVIICLVFGFLASTFAEKLMYSRFTQKTLSRKILVIVAFAVAFVIGEVISEKSYDESLAGELGLEYGFAILVSLIAFVSNLVRYSRKVAKVKDRYGSAEEGFRFDEKEKAYVKGLNHKNAEITGAYNSAMAAKTRTGVYVGVRKGGVLSFNGIPYAKAPVGNLRWKAPEKLPDSDRVFEAKYFGPSAIQVNYEGNLLSAHQQSEDCLTLNIRTKARDLNRKKPVVVYFHGGDFTYGGAADPLWELSNFVKKHPDVVAVSFNYRLGLLGFIDFSAIPGGEEYPDTVNLGLLDQIAALEWIRENIAAFGGDPEQITVMGDSSGGISISLLAICERAKGLFRNAVIFSGTPEVAKIKIADPIGLAARLLMAGDVSCMEELLALPEEKIAALTQELSAYMTTPDCDGRLIPKEVYKACQNGAAGSISFILCGARDMAAAYSAAIGRDNCEDLFADIFEVIFHEYSVTRPELTEKLVSIFAEKEANVGKAKAEAELLNLIDHMSFLELAEDLRSGGSSVRAMYWDMDAVIESLGVSDVNIVSTFLGNSEFGVSYGSVVDETVRDILQTLVLKFIHGEAPELYTNEIKGVDEINWEVYPDVLVVSKDDIQLQSAGTALKDAKKLLQISEGE